MLVPVSDVEHTSNQKIDSLIYVTTAHQVLGLIGRKCWFKTGHQVMETGTIVDLFYDGLLVIEEIRSKKLYISNENEIELI